MHSICYTWLFPSRWCYICCGATQTQHRTCKQVLIMRSGTFFVCKYLLLDTGTNICMWNGSHTPWLTNCLLACKHEYMSECNVACRQYCIVKFALKKVLTSMIFLSSMQMIPSGEYNCKDFLQGVVFVLCGIMSSYKKKLCIKSKSYHWTRTG